MKKIGFFSRFSFAAFAMVVLCACGCNDSSQQSQHGAGQNATSQEKEMQNRNLLDQVVQATENQENYSDPAYLRGALGRLNSWLAEKEQSADFEPDAEFDALYEKFGQLLQDSRRLNELVRLFADETKTPEEKDGEEMQRLVESVEAQTKALAVEMKSNALASYGLYFADLKEQLAGAREFQFADATETFQTKIREFTSRPVAEYYSCEAFVEGISDFQRLLDVDGKIFLPQDADYLREAVWFRNVFSWAKGDKQDDLIVVDNLFDWSVRNVVITPLMPSPAGPMAQLPWQTLLLSQGAPIDRALVFMELLRQHRLDAFVLRPEEDRDDFPLVVGVRLNGETYLYLPELGLPIPSEGDDALTLDSGLKIKVATLSQVAANDSLLRRFDLEGKPFPATAKDFEKMVAYVPSTPFTVAARMIPMEQEFSGAVNTVLSTAFDSQKSRVAELAGIASVKRLYEATAPILEQTLFTFEQDELTAIYMLATTASSGNLEVTETGDSSDDSTNIADYTSSSSDSSSDSSSASAGNTTSTKKAHNAALWIGKNLYLKGKFIDDSGASRHFLSGRVSDRVLKQEESSIQQRVRSYLTQYVEYCANQNHTPTQDELNALGSEAASAMQMEVNTKRYVKVLTSFYLALLSEAAGNDSAALERLNDDTLRLHVQTNNTETRSYSDEFRYGANYLRALLLEKQGSIKTAISRLTLDPRNVGALVRAQWLAQLSGEDVAIPTATPAEEKPAVEEQPAVEETAQEPTVEEQPAAEEPAQEPTVEEQPAVEETAQKPAVEEQPAAEEPAQEPTVEEQPAVEETAQEPAVEEQPAVEETAQEPAVEEQPAVEETVQEPAVEEQPAAEETAQE